MDTVLITGCSSGFGRETAAYFLQQGWTVVATMRDPAANTLPASDRFRVLPLDVTDPGSISAAVDSAGEIDVLVNNAGVGWLNAIEGSPMQIVREVFETNTFSMVAMMQAVLPGMRRQRSGVIVNVSSSTTLAPMPLLSIYRASKAAVNALTEAAALELAEFGIRARVVVPGASPETNFGKKGRAKVMAQGGFLDAYAEFAKRTLDAMQQHSIGGASTKSEDVANAIFRAATDPDCPMILPAGADAVALLENR